MATCIQGSRLAKCTRPYYCACAALGTLNTHFPEWTPSIAQPTVRSNSERVMRIAEIASAPVFVAYPEQPLAAAAHEMRTHGVGALVVVDPGASGRRPVGILTDRDIVCGQLARSADLYCLAVQEVMTRDPVTVSSGAGLTEAIGQMTVGGVRRAPVVDETGVLVGIITLDDLLPVVAQELNELAGIAHMQALNRRAPVAPPEPLVPQDREARSP
jgi:CBS domain-containing protein